ncbi:MAG: hypothetical protein LDL44_20860, partial [Caenispirillum sp.]|nr:hypothetical protein [Caenispirillum sp.]
SALAAAPEPEPAPMTPWPEAAPAAAEAPDASSAEVASSCCKHCSKGKPCGDSCIARDKTCKRPPGCACGLETPDDPLAERP